MMVEWKKSLIEMQLPMPCTHTCFLTEAIVRITRSWQVSRENWCKTYLKVLAFASEERKDAPVWSRRYFKKICGTEADALLAMAKGVPVPVKVQRLVSQDIELPLVALHNYWHGSPPQ